MHSPDVACKHTLYRTVTLPCILRVKRANMQASVICLPHPSLSIRSLNAACPISSQLSREIMQDMFFYSVLKRAVAPPSTIKACPVM